jgi:hypothetical protein
MTITLQQYWNGRDAAYAEDFTLVVQRNAATLLAAVNELLTAAEDEGVTALGVASGWRPQALNDRTAHAGKHSKHITGEAVDLEDNQERGLARWCLRNLEMLEVLGLWMERPQWTGGQHPWVHLQSSPPGSGKRVFIPSTAPPLAQALPEESALA